MPEPLSDERPDWWPETPYPESVFTMTEAEYVQAVPDPNLRTRISGFLYREGWNVADRMIFERWNEEGRHSEERDTDA